MDRMKISGSVCDRESECVWERKREKEREREREGETPLIYYIKQVRYSPDQFEF